jgi:GntR family transcriptional regulator
MDILNKCYSDGRRLPTEAELATTHRLSRQTVRRAFQDLVSEGMVVRVPGRGTFVAERDRPYLRHFGSVEDLMGLSIDTQMEIVDPLHRTVDLDAASRLRLESDAVYTVVFRRLHQGTPFCVTTVLVPPAIGRELSGAAELAERGKISNATVIGLLDERLAAPISEADQSITAAAASESVAARCDCRPGAPVLRVDRLYFDVDDKPVELGISYFVPEHYSYRVRLRRSHP